MKLVMSYTDDNYSGYTGLLVLPHTIGPVLIARI